MTPIFLEAFMGILEVGKMPSNLNSMEIVFIPKNNNHFRINN